MELIQGIDLIRRNSVQNLQYNQNEVRFINMNAKISLPKSNHKGKSWSSSAAEAIEIFQYNNQNVESFYLA